MRTLTLDAKFRVVENNTSPNEQRPRVDFYWSGHLQRQRISIPFPSSSESEWQSIRVTGKVANQNCPLPENAALCMQSFAERCNEYGVPCVTDAGTASVSLGDLTAHNFRRNGAFVRQIPMLMRTSGNFVKSIIEFRVDDPKHISFTGGSHGTLPISLQLAPCPIQGPVAGTQLVEYIQSTMRMSHDLEDAFEGTSNMRVPFNYSQTGFQMLNSTQIALPAISYTMIEVPPSNNLFWRNALTSVLKRHGQTTKQLLAASPKEQAILANRLTVYPVQNKPYIGDTIDKNVRGAMRPPNPSLVIPYENFGPAFIGSKTAASAGDCEDFSNGILTVNLALTSCNFSTIPGEEGKLLEVCQAHLRKYVPVMVLACVHGQQLSDSDKNKVGGAHMTILMFPMHYFKACLERTEEGRRLSSITTWPTSREDLGYGLECFILEGTGMLEVEPGADPKAAHRAKVYRETASWAGLKKWLYQPKDENGHSMESRFFMAALEGYTPVFRQRFGRPEYGGFWIMNKDNKRGGRFVDFMDQTDNFALLPQPPLPESVVQLIVEGMQMLAPLDPFYLTDTDSAKNDNAYEKLALAELNKLAERTASLARPEKVKTFISAFLSPYQMTETLGNEMWKDIQKNDFICAVSYDVERITDAQTSYRIKFHL